MQRVGPFLLVHDLAVDLQDEVDAERYHLLPHNDHFIQGWLFAGPEDNMFVRITMAEEGAQIRRNTMHCMADAFEAKVAVLRIEAAYLS